MKKKPIPKLLMFAFCLIMLSACTLQRTTEITSTSVPDGNIEPTQKPLHCPVPGPTTAIPLPTCDGGLLTKDPCGPPCFLGIVPDVTTYDETVQILTDYQYCDACEEWDTYEDTGTLGIRCSQTFSFYFDPDKSHVYEVVFIPQQEITVQDLIDEFGEPAYLNVIVLGYEESIRETTTRLYYPDLRMAIWLKDQKGSSYVLEPTTKIRNVKYLGGDLDESIYKPSKQDWQGYIEYFKKQ